MCPLQRTPVQHEDAGTPLALNVTIGMASAMGTFAGLGTQVRRDPNDTIQATGGDLPSKATIEAGLNHDGMVSNPEYDSSNVGSALASSRGGAASSTGTSVSSMQFPEPICVTLGEFRIASAECGPYTLIVQSSSTVGSDTYPIALLSNIQQLVSLHLGPFSRLTDESDMIVPILDLIDDLVQGYSQRLETMLGTSSAVYIDRRIRAQLDQLLIAVEEVDNVMGSALFLGSQQLHSRLPPRFAFWVSRLLAARPMGTVRTRALPLYFQGSWLILVLTRLQHMTLALTLPIRASFLSVLPLVQDLEAILTDSELPTPETPPLLTTRNLTSRGVLLCAFVHYPSGSSVIPTPRRAEAVSDTDSSTLFSIFHSFFHKVSSVIRPGQTSIVKLSSHSYRFIAIAQIDFALYALFPERLDETHATRACEEIILSATQQMGLNISAGSNLGTR